MGSVKDRLDRLEKTVSNLKREITYLKDRGASVVPEYADLKTIARLFGNYSVTTLRYRIRAGLIPPEMVRKETRKLLIHVKSYREMVARL
jgi:ATP sulfurylase